jgi:hypothetical protein
MFPAKDLQLSPLEDSSHLDANSSTLKLTSVSSEKKSSTLKATIMMCALAVIGAGVSLATSSGLQTITTDRSETPLQAVTLVVTGKSSVTDLVQVAAAHGLTYTRSLSALNAAVVEGRGERAPLITLLESDPRVRSVSANLRFDVAGDCCGGEVNVTADDVAEGFHLANQEVAESFGALRERTRGRATTRVAILDTGLDTTHPDLQGVADSGRSFAEGSVWSEDKNGHGTAMASLVAARAQTHDTGLEGVAPGVSLIVVQVADAQGRAFLADVAAGIVHAVDSGAHVVLMSLGSSLPSPLLEDALAYAEARDVLVVAAAGNRNTHVDLFPAADPRVISVGALASGDRLAGSTALSPTTDLLVPGVEIGAALPRGSHATVTGTSVAAARLAGAAALVRELAPNLELSALRSLLRGATRPLPLFADQPDLARVFRAGIFDPARLLAELDSPRGASVLSDPRVLPTRVVRGEEVACSIRLSNAGVQATPAQRVSVEIAGQAVGTLDVAALAPGAETLATLRVLAPATGEVVFSSGAQRLSATLSQATLPVHDAAIAHLEAHPTEAGGLTLTATVEGRGGAIGGSLEATVGETLLGRQPLEALAPGQRATVTFEATAEQIRALGRGRIYQAHVRLTETDDDPANSTAALDLEVPASDGGKLRTQYQQGGKLNIIADAPTRLGPGKTHVPLLVSVPEKGDLDPNTWVEINSIKIATRTSAAGNGGTVIYEDTRGGATTAAPNLVLLDENGQAVRRGGAPDLRLFQHDRLTLPGRYNILRLPRNAFGVASVPTALQDRFIDVTVNWRNKRRFLNFFSQTDDGTTRWVLRVRFPGTPRPQLAGLTGRYYDAHLHTMAEWHQEDGFNLLAPRRNLGGPIPMIKEAAYALGITDAVDAVGGHVVTTDHSSFYNQGDSLRDRPPFGPTSVNAGGGGEHAQMKAMFGLTTSEEVAFHANNPFFNTGILSGVQMPTGAHMLAYRAQHIEGPWHGGSSLARALGDNYPNLELEDLVRLLASSNRGENSKAAGFAAHPMSSSSPWKPSNFEFAFGLDPQTRTDDIVHAEGTGFVVKGLQIWNGGSGRHKLDTSRIDWNDVNPWADPGFVAGNPDWDKELNDALIRYHDDVSSLLEYELVGNPGVRFPRKVFALAGNDAHGDFNYGTSRIATILNLKSTFGVKSRSFGHALTYALGDLQDPQSGASSNERAFEAMLDGNSVLTDGPLLLASLDAEDRFDSAALRWHDSTSSHEDVDGHVGGGGDFDGRGTMLVRRSSSHVRFGYRYETSPEFGERGGDIESIAIYRTSVGDPNPGGTKPSGAVYLEPRGWLATPGEGADHEETLDANEEGLIDAASIFQVAGYTGTDPAALGRDEARCISNPIWAVPFDVSVSVGTVDVDGNGNGEIPVGALTVTYTFDMSMTPSAYAVEIKALDTNGDSSDSSTGPIDVLTPQGTNNGWSSNGTTKNARFELTNSRAIPVNLDRFPANGNDVTFVVYFKDAPQDPFGNPLNRIASSFVETGVGTGGGTGPAVNTGTTAPGSTASSTGRSGSGSSGCSLQAQGPTGSALFPLLLLLGLAGLRRAQRVEVR